jgi:putative DNA methylase
MSAEPRRKLIEVALPLEAINRESAREKSIRHGHPSTLHLWWARRPLAACRAVLFASLVDDPSSRPDLFSEVEADAERERLFRLMERLVAWDATTDAQLLEEVREQIRRSTGANPPLILDPFCGGGSIPLEAQRLGLGTHASDLNPVAVLIAKALIEIPPKFRDKPPVNAAARERLDAGGWRGARGLAEDVRYYGRWTREEARKRVGNLYPKAKLSDGSDVTVIAWLWTRTVRCPNPACGLQTPLLSSFVLASRKGRERYLEPVVDGDSMSFRVRSTPGPDPQDPKNGYKRGVSGVFECAFCSTVTTRDYVAAEGKAGRIGAAQTAVVVSDGRSRDYHAPRDLLPAPVDPEEVDVRGLDNALAQNPRDVWCRNFGLETPADLFTHRQLRLLTSLSDLVAEARQRVLDDGGQGDYADAVATYLGLAVSKLADYNSSLVVWSPSRDQAKATFARQALPMVWDFAEVNPFAEAAGDFLVSVRGIAETLERLPSSGEGVIRQLDATSAVNGVVDPLVCTDPPYYDNIGYADLADFFYVWLRRALKEIYPDLFSTVLTPKSQELVAIPYRFAGDKKAAQAHFEEGLRKAFARIHEVHSGEFPMTLFYAFKQAEADKDGVASTGWETMLDGLLGSGFMVTGTWPMRTERGARSVAIGTAALASSIILVCRPRPEAAALATRKEFTAALRAELPEALRRLQSGSIAPVDLAQAAIGPGMAVFSRYSKVVEADGNPMRVRIALALINEALDELLAEQEADFDVDTRWCGAWFEQYAMDEGPFGMAETLSRAKNTAINGLVEAGVVQSRAGKVRLLDRTELEESWDPAQDARLTVWEVTQHLIARHQSEGEEAAAELLRQVGGGLAEAARELAYRLFAICERKGWAQEALGYNALVSSWPEITRLAARGAEHGAAGEQEAMEV